MCEGERERHQWMQEAETNREDLTSTKNMTENQPESQPQLQPSPQPQALLLSQSEPLTQPQALPQPQALYQTEPQLQLQEEVKPRVWTRHCRLLLLLLGSSFCASILGLAYYCQQHLPTESTGVRQVHTATLPCLSSACQRAAARLSVSVDPFTQPCDYFLFTCGSEGTSLASRGRQRGKGLPHHLKGQKRRGALAERGRRERRETEIDTDREEEPSDDRMPDRQTALLQSLREILESESQSGPVDSAQQKACGFYQSCMDTGPTETAGAEPFLRLIQKLGGWAVSGQWNQTDLNSTLSLLMSDYATFPFFSLYVGKDPNDVANGGNKRYIQIDQPDFLIPIEWSSKTHKSKAKTQMLRPFLATYQRYLVLLGSPTFSTGLHHVGQFLSLSSELAVAASPLPYRLMQGLLYQRLTIRELQTLAPAIDWLGCLQATFHPHPISQWDHVLLHNLPYITHMSRIICKWLNKHELSASDSLHTYMVLNLLHKVVPALDSRFTETERNFSLVLGNKEVVPRWRQCVLQTERGFDEVLTHLLRERTEHREVEEMIQKVYSAFTSKLADLKWRDEESRMFALNKVQTLTPKLATKTEIFSEAELNQLFSKVTISDYFSNYIQMLSLQQKRRNRLLSQPEEADILSITPFLSGDELVFPMGMFVPPLFHPTFPRAVNYGVLGFLMAKDILHLLLPDIHSQSETVQTVGECMWAQYLSVMEGPGRVGAFTLSPAQQQEMWVQYSALQMALQAYNQSLKSRPGDSSLSGLSYSHLFLTSFSQINCNSDPYHEFMPFEPSFLMTVICANSDLCPTNLTCLNKPQQHLLRTC